MPRVAVLAPLLAALLLVAATAAEGGLAHITCMTSEERKRLVGQCRERAKKMHRYLDVWKCFDGKLRAMMTTRRAMFALGTDAEQLITCMVQRDVIDAMVTCALAQEPAMGQAAAHVLLSPAAPAASAKKGATTPAKATVRRAIARLAPAKNAPVAQSVKLGLKTGARQYHEKIPLCSKDFPCCLFAGESVQLERDCFAFWCLRNRGC